MPRRKTTELETVELMKRRRLGEKTMRNYESRIRVLERWIQDHENPEVNLSYNVELGQLVLPLLNWFLLGFAASLLGTHSFRKGSATYAQSFNGGPTSVAIYHRAGWSLGNVQQRYIFPTEAADQLLGRVLCGLPWGNINFCVLPPHFKSSTIISEEEWNEMVPGYSNYPACFQVVIPFLIASVIYHLPWIIDNFPSDHQFFQSRFYTSNVYEKYKSEVLLGFNYCEDNRMTAAGIPETLIISEKVSSLETIVRSITKHVEDLDVHADDRQVELLNLSRCRCKINK